MERTYGSYDGVESLSDRKFKHRHLADLQFEVENGTSIDQQCAAWLDAHTNVSKRLAHARNERLPEDDNVRDHASVYV